METARKWPGVRLILPSQLEWNQASHDVLLISPWTHRGHFYSSMTRPHPQRRNMDSLSDNDHLGETPSVPENEITCVILSFIYAFFLFPLPFTSPFLYSLWEYFMRLWNSILVQKRKCERSERVIFEMSSATYYNSLWFFPFFFISKLFARDLPGLATKGSREII